jgi:single-stranded DNA-specific DHH superfamily exonuclease
MQFDVFNGDADGICALAQLRLAKPMESILVTGIKRDIELLTRVQAGKGDHVTVLDVSLAKNYADVMRLLAAEANVFYVDHHQAGEIPIHPQLLTVIDTSADICTSLLVNQYLDGRFKEWAIVGAFGDNLNDSAKQLAADLMLENSQLMQLKNLGICINYNGYGSSVNDLHFSPDVLYCELAAYTSPFDFMTDNAEIYQKLLTGYDEDMTKALQMPTEYENQNVAVYVLPNEVWSRRVSGVFGNELANQYPHRAHAVITENAQDGYLVSVRASLIKQNGADELCALFPTGGGRKSAAGINHLPKEQLTMFIDSFAKKMR